MSDFLTVSSLSKVFELSHGFLGLQKKKLMAVSNVSFKLKRGEVLGLVGESGSGKSTLGRCLLRLIEPTSGKIEFKGTDITEQDSAGMRAMRQQMQMVFQDSYSSLDPRKSVRATLTEARTIQRLSKDENSLIRIMERVGLTAQQLDRYPHEFSGGQRQRIGIARALSVEPEFIIADEPVSALDVSIQAQIINLLADLKSELNLGMLFIGHDLAVVEHISDRVMVLYLGKVMEAAPSSELFSKPKHPYTEALLSAAPQIGADRGNSERIILAGEQPSPADPPSGCVFRTRCRFALSECAMKIPDLKKVGADHFKACIRDDVL